MKVNVYVAAGNDAPCRICWYMNTSDAQVEKAIRIQLRLPRDTEFLLEDADGDVVPVSSTLPNGQHFAIVMQEDSQVPIIEKMDLSANVIEETNVILPYKRKRLDESETAAIPAPTSPLNVTDLSTVLTTLSTFSPPRSIATIIAQFVDTFTRPIANDDNIGFIPNTGRFALYDLYCEVVQDKKYHPKREDVFYKMTSMHGKVDRQRVNRYYQCPSENGEGTEIVQCKPQGKGVLLRRYRKLGKLEELENVVKIAPFISWLKLDPNEVVTRYSHFVKGFEPVSKSNYRTTTPERDEAIFI
ncbi:uncharacterized protein PHALS_08499 [Plasmopara halstedii]|uniref:Uncharacterized protein n=1 Tax=Plasmopara halstedii TaxID=4781 RepID=A0A0P1AD03_PLAHL|nr:uncharacterized protein PHALS_08499 [Plasmopara halstedii]CEG38421.1 hypothetical protein PHALS_08499 [Plasmopara halstedii]|eukprot:XP_024574790.1 hypothetical protein PHALS_08499 [Plasmopara halstedii]